MRGFSYHVPTKVVFGADSLKQLPELTKEYGTRAIVVSGGSSAKKSGLLDRVFALLDGAGVAYDTISGVQPNPRAELAREGVQKAIAFGAEVILAVGGGSVIDTAKAIAHGAANPDTDIWEFWSGRQKVTKTLPVGVVLTIPAAGSETSDSAVLTNVALNEKRGLSTQFNRPAFALLDPVLAVTLPKRHIACGVVDIMMHTMDRYFNPISDNEITDRIAESLLRVVIENGTKVYADASDVHAMSEIMWCGSLSHNGLTGLGGNKDFAPHQLGHGLSEKYDAIHGESLSCVWGSWARYVCPVNPARFAQYARNVWDIAEQDDEEAAMLGIERTEAYFRSLDMPICFTQLGLQVHDEAGIADLAERCSHHGKRTIGSFRVLSQEDMAEIYRMANK